MATIRSFIKFWMLSAFAVYGWLRLRLTRSPTLIILTYHRVLPEKSAEREREQPGMIISPENLQRHIKLVRALGAAPVHLDEWLRKKNAGEALPALAVAFTFDDGWRDNYLYGYPVLRQEQVPATIFLVTKMIDTGETFWPENVIGLLRTPGINLRDPSLEWLQPYLGSSLKKPTPLSLLEADEVVNRLKALDDATIIQHLKSAKSAPDAATHAVDIDPPILRTGDLKEMSANNLLKYGAHTRHHFRLNRLNSKGALTDEILGSLDDIRSLAKGSVPIFCYPNGDITGDGETLVSDHYEAACTTKTGWNNADCDPYDLHRFNLHDGNSRTTRNLLATIGRGIL